MVCPEFRGVELLDSHAAVRSGTRYRSAATWWPTSWMGDEATPCPTLALVRHPNRGGRVRHVAGQSSPSPADCRPRTAIEIAGTGGADVDAQEATVTSRHR
jgi:hypothetical protein